MKTRTPDTRETEIRSALARAQALNAQDDCDPAAWKEVETTLVRLGICPDCAAEGYRSRLRKWIPGDFYSYAGRECFECENFFPCGDQPSYERCESPSDADPGL